MKGPQVPSGKAGIEPQTLHVLLGKPWAVSAEVGAMHAYVLVPLLLGMLTGVPGDVCVRHSQQPIDSGLMPTKRLTAIQRIHK